MPEEKEEATNEEILKQIKNHDTHQLGGVMFTLFAIMTSLYLGMQHRIDISEKLDAIDARPTKHHMAQRVDYLDSQLDSIEGKLRQPGLSWVPFYRKTTETPDGKAREEEISAEEFWKLYEKHAELDPDTGMLGELRHPSLEFEDDGNKVHVYASWRSRRK